MNDELRQLVKVTKITPVNHENIKAYANVLVDGWIRVGCMRVLASKDGGHWVAWPKEKVDDDYDPVIEFDWREMKQCVNDAVLAAFNDVVLPALKSETPSQQKLEFLRRGGSASGSVACTNQSRKKWTRKAPKKAVNHGKNVNSQVFDEQELPNDDIDDVSR